MSGVIRQEAAIFLYSVWHGTLLTLMYDFWRVLRRVFRHNLLVLSLEDFLYWMLAGLLTFLLIYQRTDGTIRGYVIVGIFLGFLLYHFTFSPLVVMVSARCLSAVWKVLCLPFHAFSATARKICRFFCEISKKRIEFTRKKVYNKKKAFLECRKSSAEDADRGGTHSGAGGARKNGKRFACKRVSKRGRLKRGKENDNKDSKKNRRKEKAK